MLLVLVILAALLVGGSVRRLDYGKVKSIDKADGVDTALTVLLMEYQVSGPVSIEVISGVRAEESQLKLWAKGRDGDVIVNPKEVVTYAKHATETAHGRGGAFDFAVLVNGVQCYGSDFRHLYMQAAVWFENRGCVVGIHWVDKFPPDGDMGHVELAHWKSLALRIA